MAGAPAIAEDVILTDVPARLDRLAFSGFHWRIIIALGITWILDGLEVTLVGSIGAVLTRRDTLGLTGGEIGLAGSAYIAGAVLGALVFGDAADRFGRRTLFSITVGVYLVATILTGFAWDFWSFILFRAMTGAGIGGEYSAINSAIQEFIPARARGRTDLAINGSFWAGAALGALGSLVVLNPALLPPAFGWRFAFVIGGALAMIVIALRRVLPESPRWLIIHGRADEAARVVAAIEAQVLGDKASATPVEAAKIRLSPGGRVSALAIGRTLFRRYFSRAVLGLTLMATQAFCYNAIFFTYALILTTFYGIDASAIGWFMLPFAAGNFLGPLLLGRLFDTVGRKTMIAATYGISGLLMAATGFLFAKSALGAVTLTGAWTATFFFASAGASAAYLTVGECFPLEIRARAIAIFYALGTALGGIAGPALFGALIDTNDRGQIMTGYVWAAGLMLIAALVETRLGVAAECRPLEEVAPPLSYRDIS